MKIFITLLLCLFAFNVNAQHEDMEQLLSMQNINVSEISDICSPEIRTNEHTKIGSLSDQLIDGHDVSKSFKSMRAAKKTQKSETYSVAISIMNGFTYHIADYYGYYGNSRVITCLDGNMRGYQAIADNGVVTAESTNVKWHKNYFVHYYPYGEIHSHPNKQVLKLY